MEKQFSKMKGDERMWAIRDAAETLTRYAEITKQPDLLKAANKELESKENNIKAAQDFVKSVNSKSINLKTENDNG